MKKKAFITGVNGQDGSYLSKFLLEKNYEVHGIIRRGSTINTERLNEIYEEPQAKNKKFFLHYSDIIDSGSLASLLSQIKPDEIYNLAAQSHVKVSFDNPEYTLLSTSLGTLKILEVLKSLNLKSKFYQASSSEMFGNSKAPQNEKSLMMPESPYAASKLYSYWITRIYRDSYNIFASNGILFNHESPKRGETFVTRKITKAIAEIYTNKRKILYVGNILSKRDWGHAKDYVDGMWRILNHNKPGDYVLATGKSYTVKYLIEFSFKYLGIKIKWIKKKGKYYGAVDQKSGDFLVKIDKKYFRPLEVNNLLGDPKKAYKELKWKSKTSFEKLISEMIDSDLKNC